MTARTADPEGCLMPGTASAELVVAALRGVPPERRLAFLHSHGVPPAAVEGIVEDPGVPGWEDAVAASRERGRDLALARSATADALAAVDAPVVLFASVLGPLWWRDLDLVVAQAAAGPVADALAAAGFVDVTSLTPAAGGLDRRFAVVAQDRVLAAVDLHTRVHPGGPAARDVAARAVAGSAGAAVLALAAPEDALRRRAAKLAAARRVRVRDVLEIAELVDMVPSLAGEPVVQRAVSRGGRLARDVGVAGPLPAHTGRLRVPAGVLLTAVGEAAHRRWRRPPRVRVAFSGIDGAGKSTQARLLADALERVGVPVCIVWARIGYSGSTSMTRAVNRIQRLLPREWHSAMRERATGTSRTTPRTRRGALGWAWAFAVTVEYLVSLRRDLWAARRRLVVLDRGMADALVGLEEEFGGAVSLGLHRRLLRRWGPRAGVTFLLELPPSAAVTRKRDSFTEAVLEQHRRRYRSTADAADLRLVALDADRPPQKVAIEVLRNLASRLDSTRRPG